MLIAFLDEQEFENPPSPPFIKVGKILRLSLIKGGLGPTARRGDLLDRIQFVFDGFLASGGEKLTY